MPKQFPLEIVIGATDKATAKLKAIQDRVSAIGAPVRRVARSLAAFSQQSGLTRVGTEVVALGQRLFMLGAAGVAAGAGMAALAMRSSQAADEIGDTAARLNISTGALQAWTYGFGQADVEQQAFTSSLDTLNKNLGDAQIGMGRAVKVFQGLGIDPKRFKTVDQLLPALANKLQKVTDPAKRAAIATRLLGEAGAQMAVLLGDKENGGAKALTDMYQAAKDAGAIIDPKVIENAGKLDQRMKALKATFAGVAGNVLGQLYPALVKISEALQKILVKYQPQIEAFAKSFAEKLPDSVEKLSAKFDHLYSELRPVMDAIGWIVENFGLANTIFAALAVTIGGGLIVAIAGLAASLVTLGVAMGIGFWPLTLVVVLIGALIYAGWKLYKNWELITTGLKVFGKAWIDSWKQGWLDFKGWFIDQMNGAYEWLQQSGLYKALTWMSGKVSSLFGGTALSGSSQSAPQSAAGAALGSSLFNAAKAPPQRVEVSVDLSNLPAGTRTEARGSDGIDLGLSRGFVMPGVR